MKVLVIGEAPSKFAHEQGVKDALPLARRDLAELAGLTLVDWNERFECINVLDTYPGPAPGGKGDDFPMREARGSAERLKLKMVEHDRVVLLGRRVACAFMIDPWLDWFVWTVLHLAKTEKVPQMVHKDDPLGPWPTIELKQVLVVVALYPSKVSHWWNDRSNVARAARFWGGLK